MEKTIEQGMDTAMFQSILLQSPSAGLVVSSTTEFELTRDSDNPNKVLP